jgi:2Fe-2S ferredoxin
MVPGIEGDCGGLCACATCHVYIPEEWRAKCGEPEELEQGMLDFAFDVNENSRLGCQIEVTAELNGITIQLPERQY